MDMGQVVFYQDSSGEDHQLVGPTRGRRDAATVALQIVSVPCGSSFCYWWGHDLDHTPPDPPPPPDLISDELNIFDMIFDDL